MKETIRETTIVGKNFIIYNTSDDKLTNDKRVNKCQVKVTWVLDIF
jgi:hypothetical protein